MSRLPATPRTAPLRGSGAAPWPAVSRWLVALAVLAGFVAMHGLSADHDVHALAALPGGHHAPAQSGGGAAVTEVTAVTAGPALVEAVAAAVPAWRVPASDGHGHTDDGCLVMLASSVLALVLALLLARRAGARLSTPRPRVARLPVPRAPPLLASPGFAALGILRT